MGQNDHADSRDIKTFAETNSSGQNDHADTRDIKTFVGDRPESTSIY